MSKDNQTIQEDVRGEFEFDLSPSRKRLRVPGWDLEDVILRDGTLSEVIEKFEQLLQVCVHYFLGKRRCIGFIADGRGRVVGVKILDGKTRWRHNVTFSQEELSVNQPSKGGRQVVKNPLGE